MGCRSSLRRARAAWSAATERSDGVNQKERLRHPGVGVMTYTTRAVRGRGTGSCGSAGQAADVSVAHPVKDQFHEFSSRRNDADVAPAALTDVVAELP